MKVAKFGGTSVATAQQIQKVCAIAREDADRRFLVVSAPGKRFKEDVKVTDLLIQCAKEHLRDGRKGESFQKVVDRFKEIQADLGLKEDVAQVIAKDLEERLAGDRENPHLFTDTIKAAGEDYCARIVAQTLSDQGIEAHYVSPKDAGMILSDEYGNAQVLPESYDNLAKLKNAPGVTVFPGFFGYTRSGRLATFPRGGSDITGAILAAAVGADLYENFTDVDCVFACDPGLVKDPAPIVEMTYREMRELSYSGFAVFHGEAVQPAIQANVPICIKNTNNPSAPGTRIVPNRSHQPGDVLGIASSAGFCSVFVEKFLMNRTVGFGRKLLQIFEDGGISFQHMPSGIDNLSIILREEGFTASVKKQILRRIQEELDPEEISVESDLALVMIVGEGMSHAVGVAAQATQALAEGGINIEMINQGSSEISMMFGVKESDRPRAVQVLYNAFFTQQ